MGITVGNPVRDASIVMEEPGVTTIHRFGSQSVPVSGSVSTPEERATALAFLQKLAAVASEGSIDLPCFPEVVIRISTALADPKPTADHVVTIFGAEPPLAAR